MGLSRPLLRGIQVMGNRLPNSDTHLAQVHHCATRWPTTSSRWRAPAFLIPLISLLTGGEAVEHQLDEVVATPKRLSNLLREMGTPLRHGVALLLPRTKDS